MKQLQIPIAVEEIQNLQAGDNVLLSGTVVTARDAAHRWLLDTFIKKTRMPLPEEEEILSRLKPRLEGGVIFHCGPVVAGVETGKYRFVAAGPTTSMREEPYEADVISFFKLRGVIGKGGMGAKTLKACMDAPAVYFHAVGGAAALIAETVKKVTAVYKLEFGVPEAMWVVELNDLPLTVTMDAHGRSLHAEVQEQSQAALQKLFG